MQNFYRSKTRIARWALQAVLVLALLGGLLSVQPASPAEADDSAISFAVITDFGNCNMAEQTVATMVDGWNVDFIVTAGDNHHESGCTYGDYGQSVGNYYGDWVAAQAFWPVIGNHDQPQVTQYHAYFTYLGGANYYDFVEGPVHFFMLDSQISNKTTQQAWLSAETAASTSPWKIAVFHTPAYSGGMHGSNTAMQWDFAGMGIDYVISGHNHLYERILRNGIRYFTAGVAGGGARGGSTTFAGLEAYYFNAQGAMRVNATDTSIMFEYLTSDGVVRDVFEGLPLGPNITTSTSTLSAFTAQPSVPSPVQSYTVSGSSLDGPILVTPPAGFEVSTNQSTWYTSASPLSLEPTSGSVATTVHARLAASSAGTYGGSITHTSSDADTKNVSVTGTVSASSPTIVVNASLNPFSTTVGSISPAQAYIVSGSNLTGNITIAALSGYEYSTNGSAYSTSLNLPQIGGSVASATVYVRLTGSTTGTFNGNIVHSSTDAPSVSLAVNGTVSAIPVLTTSVSSLSSFSTTVNVGSTPQTYTVSGSNLLSDISVASPTAFQISTDGVTYSNSLTLSRDGSGTVETRTIYVRLFSTTASIYSGSITHASTGVAQKNVSVSGIVTAATTPLTSVSISGTPTVGQTLSTTLLPNGAAANYQWQWAATSGGTYTNISGATGSTYVLTSADLGRYIRVQATGTGSYTGTVTSTVIGPVVDVPIPTYQYFMPLFMNH